MRLWVAPQDSQHCGRDFAKRKQSVTEFAGNSLLRMVIIDRVINTLLGGLTLDLAGMHCPSWDDAIVSSIFMYYITFLNKVRVMLGVMVNVNVKKYRPRYGVVAVVPLLPLLPLLQLLPLPLIYVFFVVVFL